MADEYDWYEDAEGFGRNPVRYRNIYCRKFRGMKATVYRDGKVFRWRVERNRYSPHGPLAQGWNHRLGDAKGSVERYCDWAGAMA